MGQMSISNRGDIQGQSVPYAVLMPETGAFDAFSAICHILMATEQVFTTLLLI